MSTGSLALADDTVGHGSLYVIPAENPEKERLHRQYAFKRALCGWNGPVPPSVDLSFVSDVLDVAAGTCVWTLDLAMMPQIRERLSVPPGRLVNGGVTLSACDIETKFFPDKAVTDKYGIKTFQHDVTKPFSPDLHGKFDTVHVSFLFLCLTEDGWTSALRNCFDVLKPGGILLIDEADPVLYPNVSSAPSEDATGHDLDKALSTLDWIGKANRIYAGHALENGFFPDMTYRLPRMLRSAGFEVVDTKRLFAPAGRVVRTLRPDLAEVGFEEFSADNLIFIFRHLASSLFAKGKLCTPQGAVVTSIEEMERTLKEIDEGLRSEGALSCGRYCVGKKV
ncbi:S-adenosyl-L-methionine-dependent methyltransferase [Trametes punicea]|nr:S-adenosyl-L-methionine-dependent methyltransferase [Trametes punicea]